MYYLSGLLLGLSMILPIGPQNIYVLNHGLSGRLRRSLLAAAVAGVCDTALILLGAAGLSLVLQALPWLRSALLLFGALFLLRLGLQALRPAAAVGSNAATEGSVLAIVGGGLAVSWGNPHAILDTVAVLGTAIAGRGPDGRLAFAAGAISASWLFFLLLALAGHALSRLLDRGAQLWIQRGSGLLLLLFALLLAWQGAAPLLGR